MRRSVDLEGFPVSSSYEVPSYVVPFRAKTARFCGSDSWHAGTVLVASDRIKLVGKHCRMRRSSDLEGFHVSNSYELASYAVPFKAKTARFCGSDSWHGGAVSDACDRTKLVG
jgi:hypothetical protein